MRHLGCLSPVGTQGPPMSVSSTGKEPLQPLTLHFPHLRKGRRPTLILRTQLSVRVHAIIGEWGLPPPPGCSSSSTAFVSGLCREF